LNYAGSVLLPPFRSESFRFRLFPYYDRWVKSQLRPGQHLITSYAYANDSLQWVKENGGLTVCDGQNEHPTAILQVLSAEQQRKSWPYPPVSRFYHERSLQTVERADYIFAPSRVVGRSFWRHGFSEARVLLYSLPIDLRLFQPPAASRPPDRPLTILNT